MQEYKDSLIQKAETLIITGFPEKIVKLNELLETKMFADRDFADMHQVRLVIGLKNIKFFHNLYLFQDLNIPIPDPILIANCSDGDGAGAEPPPKRARVEEGSESPTGTKIRVFSNGIVKCNSPICELIKIVKPIIRSLVEDGEFSYIYK